MPLQNKQHHETKFYYISYYHLVYTKCEKAQENQLKITDANENEFFPAPVGYINDYEEAFTKDQADKLEKIISDFEAETGNQIAIVTVSSIDPYKDFNEYALDLSNHWGVGTSEKNNGLTIILVKNYAK